MWNKIIGTIFPTLAKVIDEVVLDKDAALRLKADIQLKLLELSAEETKIASNVLIAEIQGESWLQRNWRPILMLSIVAIVVNNYIIYPYLTLLGLPAAVLELPNELFSLMQIGVGGYVVGRTGEKMMKTYATTKGNT